MTNLLTPAELAEIAERAEKATPGEWTIVGATLVRCLSEKVVICAATKPRPDSGLVQYQEPDLGDLDIPGANAAFIAYFNPDRAKRLLSHIAAQAERIAELERALRFYDTSSGTIARQALEKTDG